MTQAELLQGFRVAGKTVWPAQGRVEGTAEVSRLEPRVMELLIYLARHQGEVVTRSAIIKDVWRGTAVTDDVISRSVYLIRKALGKDGGSSDAPHIETIPKRGYRLVDEILPLVQATAPMRTATAAGSSAIAELTDVAASSSVTNGDSYYGAPDSSNAHIDLPSGTGESRGADRLNSNDVRGALFGSPERRGSPAVSGHRSPASRSLIVAGLMIGVAMLASLWHAHEHSQSAPTSAAASSAPVAKQSGPPAIVVLPFAGSGAAGPDSYIGTGLSDDVTAGLGSIEGLRVIGGFSARREQADHRSYLDIGRELRVTAILEGSVEMHGSAITLNTRLIDARTGQPMRENTYEVDSGLIGQLKKSVVDDVLKSLGAAGSTSRVSDSREPKPEAYRLFLQGRYYAIQNTPGGYEQARDYFSQSVQVDPEFARGWASLGIVNMLMVDFGNRSRESATAQAAPAVKRALELDPNLAESHAAAGLVALYNGRFEESADALRRATALRPGYAQAHMWLGRLFDLHNDINRAAAAFTVAYELEPQSPMVGLNLGMALDTQGRYESAAKVLQDTLERNPKLANLYWAYAQLRWDRGELGPAADAYRAAIELGADYTELYANYAVLLSDMGDVDGAARALAHVAPAQMNEPTVWAARAAIAATSGRYAEFLGSGALEHTGKDGSFWATLARSKVEMARGNSQQALQLYELGHIEQRMTAEELAHEIKFLGGPSSLLDLACAYQRSADPSRAAHLIERAEDLIAADRARGINPSHYDYLLAAAASMRGDQARAVALIRSASERGWQRHAWFKIDPRFARLGDRDAVLADLITSKDKIAAAVRH